MSVYDEIMSGLLQIAEQHGVGEEARKVYNKIYQRNEEGSSNRKNESVSEGVEVTFCPKCASHDDDIDYLGQDKIRCRKCGYEGDEIELWIDGSFTMSDAKERILRKSGYRESAKESVDNGWQEVSGRNGYRIFRKVVDGKGKWRAQKCVNGKCEGEPFDITYAQALGREPIEDKPIAELSKKLGKILLPKRECRKDTK